MMWMHWFKGLVLALLVWRQTLAEDNHVVLENGDGVYLSAEDGQMAAIMDKLTSLDRSMAELKDQMAQLMHLSSGIGIQQVLQDLRGVCAELGASGPAPEGPEDATTDNPLGESHKCPPHPPSNQLLVTAAMKEETETSYVVTVCYVSPEKPEVTMQLEENSQPEPTEHEEFGVITVERNKPENGESAYLGLGFELPSAYYVHLSFRLNENGTEEIYLPNMQVTVDPGNEIIYNPGSDVNIKFHVINEANENATDATFNATSLDLKSRSEKNLVDRFRLRPGQEPPEGISDIQYTETNHSSGNKTLLLHMPYSQEREGGMITFHTLNFMKCRSRCFVVTHFVIQNVVFYPKGQLGPYPADFVGFVKEKVPGGVVEENSKEMVTCYEDNEVKTCLMGCMVAGDDPSIILSRVDSAPISPHTKVTFDDTKYFAAVHQDIKSPIQGDEGDYRCQAKSHDGSHVITQTMTLVVHRVAKILRSLTNVTMYSNGSLSIECTAEGDPLPKVNFTTTYDDFSTPVLSEADVTVTQLNDTTSQATLFLEDWRNYERDDLHNILCKAENVKYRSDSEYIGLNIDEY